jgi:hypothetical protein
MRKSLSLFASGLILAGFGVALVTSCGGGGEQSLVSACETPTLTGECGQPCGNDGDEECGSGLYCGSDNACTADCVSGDTRCGEGKTCSSTGHCVDDTDVDLDAGNGGGGNGGPGCIQDEVVFEKQIPNVVLLVDQSYSMVQDFDMGDDRWTVLRRALVNQNSGVVATLESEVRFGLTLYSNDSENEDAECPGLTQVPIDIDNYTAINEAYQDADPIDDTPTAEAVAAVAADLADYDQPGPKVIVLATDGEPDTCENPDANDEGATMEEFQAARQGVLDAVEAAFDDGIYTFVISVGNEVGEEHLHDVANLGQGFPADDDQDRFYLANSADDLDEAFDTIIGGVRSCVFALDGEVEEGEEDSGEITLDGDELEYEGEDGWRLNAPNELEILGAACETIKTGDHAVGIEFPCGSYVGNPVK